jgi:glycosyltransferase involved in cell wall biosynthesis
VLDDDRVDSVTINDDASTDDSYTKLSAHFLHHPKVKVYGNGSNLDCYQNKHRAMLNSKGEWCCLWDSDNTFDARYLDALSAMESWDEKTIYQPCFARPHFDFREWCGLVLTKENVAFYTDTHLMTALNACNFFINRAQYLRAWDGSVDPITSDSIFFSYTWLKAGGKILITPWLEYDHYIDPGGQGHYQQNWQKTIEFHKDLMEKIKKLS